MLDAQIALGFCFCFCFVFVFFLYEETMPEEKKKSLLFYRKLTEFYKPEQITVSQYQTPKIKLPKHMTITSRNEGLAKDSILARIMVMVKKDVLDVF